MKTLKILAIGAIVLSAVEVKADDKPFLTWSCYPEILCPQFTPVFYRDEDRADRGDGGAPSVDNGNGGSNVGGSPGTGAGAGVSRPDRENNRSNSQGNQECRP